MTDSRGSFEQYQRVVMNADIDRWIEALDPATCEVVEVGGDLRADVPWKSYLAVNYPDYDVCAPNRDLGTFDVVICEQVLEHVPDPAVAIRTLFNLTRPGGQLLVSTPFMVRIHPNPDGYWRFTPSGLRRLLEAGGFNVGNIYQWGNRTAVYTNLFSWTRKWRVLPLKNHPSFPLVIWAFVKRPN